MLTYASAQQQFVIRVTDGAVTEPVGGSWLSAYAIYLGATEPHGTWLQTICELMGITEPLNGSWIQALANYYGITEPISGNYWLDLAEAEFAAAPTANFTSDITTVPEYGFVDFEDTSDPNGAPITAWLWTFEGGTPATSTLQNPTVEYGEPGNYDVSLQVTNSEGTDTKSVPNYITVSNTQIIADFTTDPDPASINEGGVIQYLDTSYGDFATAWNWTFEGGTPATSTEANPLVQYDVPGTYDVTLQVFDESGSNTKFVPNFVTVANNSIVANFSSSTTSPTQGTQVQFSDTSTGDTATAWSWTFEGGTPGTSNAQNPLITYNTIGNFDVSLQVFDESGSDTKSVPDYISVISDYPTYTINTWSMLTYAPLNSTKVETRPMLILFK